MASKKESKILDDKVNKSVKTMDIILIIIGVLIVAFTVTILIIFIQTGNEPATLVGCVFGACFGELGIMGWIKSVKDKYLNRDLKKEIGKLKQYIEDLESEDLDSDCDESSENNLIEEEDS